MELFQEPLTAIHPGNLTDQLINKYGRLAKSFALTGWFGLQGSIEQRTAQAFAKLITGAELGLGPMASMRCIHALSDGKIELHAILVAALIRRSPKYDYRVIVRTDQECKVEFLNIEADEPVSLGVSHWDLERAKTAGLGQSKSGKKTNWQKHAMSMLFARCMTDGERTYCPDVVMVGPLYGIGEIDTQEAEAPDVMQVAKQIASAEVHTLTPPQHVEIMQEEGDGASTAPPKLRKVEKATVVDVEAQRKEAEEMLEKMKDWANDQILQGKTVEYVQGTCRDRMIPKMKNTEVKKAALEWVANEWEVV